MYTIHRKAWWLALIMFREPSRYGSHFELLIPLLNVFCALNHYSVLHHIDTWSVPNRFQNIKIFAYCKTNLTLATQTSESKLHDPFELENTNIGLCFSFFSVPSKAFIFSSTSLNCNYFLFNNLLSTGNAIFTVFATEPQWTSRYTKNNQFPW